MVSQGNRKLQLPNQFPDYFPWRQLMWWLILMSNRPDCLDWHEKTHRRRCGPLLQVAAQVKKVVTEDSSPAFVVSALPLSAEWTDPVVAVADFFAYIRTGVSGFCHGLKNRSSPVWGNWGTQPCEWRNFQVVSLSSVRQPLWCYSDCWGTSPMHPVERSDFPELAGQPFWQ